MIYARLYGGMGNQMYQYAFCKKLQKEFGQDIYFDVSQGTEYATSEADKHKATVLNDFSMNCDGVYFVESKREFNKIAGINIKVADLLDYLPRLVRKVTKSNTLYHKLVNCIQKNFNKYGYFTAFDCYCEPIYNKRLKNVYVNGLFSCKDYFDDIHEVLICDFKPSSNPNDRNIHYLKLIQNSNSVCVHVRKGNSYVNNAYLNVCSGKYFSEAMDLMEKYLSNVVFYIFSNDFDWCKKEIDFGKHKCILVDANDSQHAVDELNLMSNCKHFILSNSTMGWWAQYLNVSSDKLVISPSTWAKGKVELLADLIENNWIKVEV